MKVLAIGGNGFIGTPAVRELLDHRHEVAILHRNPAVTSHPGAVHIRGDRDRLRDCEPDLRRFGPEVIVDFILSSGRQAEELAALARYLGARVVAISSMDVYRAWGVLLGTEPGKLDPMPITEDSPLRVAPASYPPEVLNNMKAIFTWVTADYDKVQVERVIMAAATRSTVVRLPMVYGPGDPLHRFYGVIKRIRDGRPAILLPDDYAAWRGPRGYVENVAHAVTLAVTSDQACSRTYHVCEEPALTELEWQQKIAAQTNWRGRFVVLPPQQTPKHLLLPGNAAQHLVATSERIRAELGYTEPVAVDEAIRRTIAWEQDHPPTGASFHGFDYAAEDAALRAALA